MMQKAFVGIRSEPGLIVYVKTVPDFYRWDRNPVGLNRVLVQPPVRQIRGWNGQWGVDLVGPLVREISPRFGILSADETIRIGALINMLPPDTHWCLTEGEIRHALGWSQK